MNAKEIRKEIKTVDTAIKRFIGRNRGFDEEQVVVEAFLTKKNLLEALLEYQTSKSRKKLAEHLA